MMLRGHPFQAPMCISKYRKFYISRCKVGVKREKSEKKIVVMVSIVR